MATETWPVSEAARNRLVQQVVDVAAELARLVRREGPTAVGNRVAGLPAKQAQLLPIVLASMVPIDQLGPDDLLAWVHVTSRWEQPQPQRPAWGSRRRRPCGTPAGYEWHRSNGEDPCEPCRIAHRVYSRQAKRAKKAKLARRAIALRPCGTHAAYARHIRNGEDPCEECKRGEKHYRFNLAAKKAVSTLLTENAA